MSYKKIEVNEGDLPIYDVSQVFDSIKSLGYTITDINVSEAEVESEDEYKNIVIEFVVTGLPVLNSFEDGSIDVSVGSSIVNIHATESTIERCYYIVDVVSSAFNVDNNVRQYHSMVVDTILQMLVKTLLRLKTPESEEQLAS